MTQPGAATTIAVPFYVGRRDGWRPGDAVFDHPTPLGGEPTLPRLLDSLHRLHDTNLRLVVVVAHTHEELADAAELWARTVMSHWQPPGGMEVRLFAASHHRLLEDALGEDAALLDPTRYSGVRNLCLAAALLSGAETLVLLDDDEAIGDGRLVDALCAPLVDDEVDAHAGLYLEGGRDGVRRVPARPGDEHFDTASARLRAFERLVEHGEPVEAPFAFGGNLALAARLFAELPFDPAVPRGEDVDYILSARLFGYRARLDPRLRVEHHAPPNANPRARQIYEDGRRFLIERRKLRCAVTAGAPDLLPALAPYPADVLTDDLGERLARALAAVAADAHAAGRTADAGWALEAAAELATLEGDLEGRDPWQSYRALAQRWSRIAAALQRQGEVDVLLASVAPGGAERMS